LSGTDAVNICRRVPLVRKVPRLSIPNLCFSVSIGLTLATEGHVAVQLFAKQPRIILYRLNFSVSRLLIGVNEKFTTYASAQSRLSAVR
jgi:hypothetical protein